MLALPIMPDRASLRQDYELLPLPDTTTSPENSGSEADGRQPQELKHEGRTGIIDLKIPFVLAISIIIAVIFALINHFFYRYWNGRVVAGDSQQQWIIRGGTMFAFGFKTSLAMGSATSYIQYLWMSLRSRPYRAGEIDDLFAVLTNAFKFTDFKLWSKLPLLWLLAIVTWYV